MIASPSDVGDERVIVREVIAEWNAVNSRAEAVCLMPVGWETHSSPELAGRPQQIINERLLENVDLLVGIFWTRVGSPTGENISGSVEEIERHLSAGKPVMLYFSTAPVVPSSLEPEQYEALGEFKKWAMEKGLIETYETAADFRAKFSRQLQIALKSNQHLLSLRRTAATTFGGSQPIADTPAERLGSDAIELLKAAGADKRGMILIRRHLGGTHVSAGGRKFSTDNEPRSAARWIAAAEELADRGFTRDINGEGEIYELNHLGYETAETLN
jgi:hypothetical protein